MPRPPTTFPAARMQRQAQSCHRGIWEDFSTKLKFYYREKNDASLGCRGRQ